MKKSIQIFVVCNILLWGWVVHYLLHEQAMEACIKKGTPEWECHHILN